MYDFPGGDEGHEWIEVFSQDCTNITELVFYEHETSHRLYLHSGTDLLCQDYAVIVKDPDVFLADYPNFSGNLIDTYFGSLKNTGEQLELRNSDKQVIDQVTYENTYASGDSFTLEKVGDDWIASTTESGTPGFPPKESSDHNVTNINQNPTEPKQEPVVNSAVKYGITDNNTSKREEKPSEPLVTDTIQQQIQDSPTGFTLANPFEGIKSFLHNIWSGFAGFIESLF